MDFVGGDRVEVYSRTQEVWTEATVVEVVGKNVKVTYTTGGILKMLPAADVRLLEKFVEEEQISVGDGVEVWSKTQQNWVKAKVSEVSHELARRPSGSVKVVYSIGGWEKWVSPDEIEHNVRVESKAVEASVVAIGEKVEVWSRTQGCLVEGTVTELASSVDSPSLRRLGSLKITYANGGIQKWVEPDDISRSIDADVALQN